MKALATALFALTLAGPALAEDAAVEWTLRGANFDPPVLTIEAKSTFTLKFTNTNAVAAELECKDLKIEKPVVAGGSIMVRVLNPKPGSYDCVDEPHEDVAKGQIVIK
jgi:hypothetical protein